MRDFLAALAERVLLSDGAMGTRVQALDLDVERDFQGCENCTEVLTRTRPEIIRDIHRSYLAAGADVIQTNTFGGSPITLGEFGLQEQAFSLNRAAAELANEAAAEFASAARPRFVLGSVGPGTRLPSLGRIDYASLEAALTVQCRGLIAGGVDAILIETCQDPLQIKAAVNGAKAARAEAGLDVPLLVQVTVETTGTLLVGMDIAAAATILKALDVPSLGLNCATGPQEMADHLKWLGQNWPGFITVQPNAGLPELVDGRTAYPLSPAEMASWLGRFLEEDGVNLIGGCCGTTPEHIAALDAMLRQRAGGGERPAPKPRAPSWTPSVASLYSQVALRQENAYLSIGERCNANGSRRFRQLQEAGDWEGCVAMGREQEKEGSHALDLCTAFVGRDEAAEMAELVARMRGAINVPLVIDSTDLGVIEAALKLYGGKPVINSINFEDGEEPAAQRLELAKRFGAAVIALTIDEEGMAKSAERKVAVARRLHDFACERHGLPPSDLLFDPLTFTICTGNEDDRKLGLWTLQAIEEISRELSECQIILGLSNISFGLNPPARHVLNSVFLDHALRRGLTGAILHVSKIQPLYKIPEAEVQVAEDFIFDRRRAGYDPLQAYLELFASRGSGEKVKPERAARVEERLKQRIIEGDTQGLEQDLEEAMRQYAPLEIINEFLLDGMRVVGDLFGSGKMQLPFVLLSAETMKAAVGFLEPSLQEVEGREQGTMVLATVKGDVHDIGKNLVDILLTNNGYKVVNLGIKQPLANILRAAEEHKADALGMSGLLVKSTVIMRENLEEMSRLKLSYPVLLGGAALTRRYVEEDCRRAYACGRVAYARDAFEGLHLMAKVTAGTFDAHLATTAARQALRAAGKRRAGKDREAAQLREAESERLHQRRMKLAAGVAVPTPPFWGPRLIEAVPIKALLPFLNETTLFQFQWGFRKEGRDPEAYRAWARRELRPILRRILAVCERESILQPQAIYGYWKCAGEGNDLIIFAPDGSTELLRLTLPRQTKDDGRCIADYFRDVTVEERDVLGLQLVTMGRRASEAAREWFGDDRYQDYLYLHGFSVEMAEAMAEYIHKRIRAELGIGHEDARGMAKLLRQGYRGSRYSFGYPACPNLGDQRRILDLLGAERIGVRLTEEDQLEPEQSTSAIVVHHPRARYFSV
ncbi:MAG: methionine synthase [Candidatus Tectomicrobia bacterium]|nr:methionine synthase [Candidatus Tectomicrobia bacterium]